MVGFRNRYRKFSSNEIELVVTSVSQSLLTISLDAAFDRAQYVWYRRVRQVDCGGQYGARFYSLSLGTRSEAEFLYGKCRFCPSSMLITPAVVGMDYDFEI